MLSVVPLSRPLNSLWTSFVLFFRLITGSVCFLYTYLCIFLLLVENKFYIICFKLCHLLFFAMDIGNKFYICSPCPASFCFLSVFFRFDIKRDAIQSDCMVHFLPFCPVTLSVISNVLNMMWKRPDPRLTKLICLLYFIFFKWSLGDADGAWVIRPNSILNTDVQVFFQTKCGAISLNMWILVDVFMFCPVTYRNYLHWTFHVSEVHSPPRSVL